MTLPNPAQRDGTMVRGNSGASRTTTGPATQRIATRSKKTAPAAGKRALNMVQCSDGVVSEDRLTQIAALGFNAILARTAANDTSSFFDLVALRAAARLASARDVSVLLDVDLHRLTGESALSRDHPTWFRRVVAGEWPIDPRRDLHAREILPRFDHPEAAAGLTHAFAQSFIDAGEAGATGFAINWPQKIPATVMRTIIETVQNVHPAIQFTAWAPGLNSRDRIALAEAGFQASFCSLPWWDFRAPWFVDELNDLRKIGGVIAPVVWPDDADTERAMRALKRSIATAKLCGDGWILQKFPFGAEAQSVEDAQQSIVATANRTSSANSAPARCVNAPWSRVGAWLQSSDTTSTLTLINADRDHHASVPLRRLAGALGIEIETDALVLAPAEVSAIALPPSKSIEATLPADALTQAIAAPRVMIESVTPSIDDGQFPAKRTIGETMVVEADVFSDGHPVIAARLLWRAADSDEWTVVRMRALGNDRWRGEFPLRRAGVHHYTIEGGIDEFAGLRSGLEKKTSAGQNVALDAEEARLFIESVAKQADAEWRPHVRALVHTISTARDPASRILAPDVAELMAAACAPAFLSRASRVYSVLAERRAAGFSSWYELFPRSMGHNGKHGTLLDVIEQLPRIQAMGFDVLYFPPIHPIGQTNRKGKNNSLVTKPSEPGSPYAIGAKSGGHDAIHPDLGTLDDFLTLVAAARKHGLELALDFAVQCSPDHPWLAQHPEWFAWRPDGSMRYAENPPKKYEDIVNVDFYAKDAKPALWMALRDVVAFWMKQGVRIFRVDNPHTKPLPFWEWLIADLRAVDPNVIFLAEAFTRPKLMHRLAKIGFAQSYTYFTWRNTRAEIETYLKELNAAPVRDFFRPHFFVNTPDINPYFLQTSGRPGFLIRAALATTLSGLWGMYSGFELCEAAALPGKEEFLDSEKYELRPRDWNAPGNINAEITSLNRIRRENPALHTHLGVSFYICSNSSIVYFGKATPSRDNVVLVAINLDPHHAQEADIEIPLWEFGLDDNAALCAEELTGGYAFDWRGKHQHIRLDAETPYRIWRVRSEKDR